MAIKPSLRQVRRPLHPKLLARSIGATKRNRVRRRPVGIKGNFRRASRRLNNVAKWDGWTRMASLAAVVALLFAAQSLVAAQRQVNLAEQGQFDDRYTKAVQALSSSEPVTRLAAVYSLERLTVEVPERRTAVVAVLIDYLVSRTAVGMEVEGVKNELNTAARVVAGTRSAHIILGFMEQKLTIVAPVGENWATPSAFRSSDGVGLVPVRYILIDTDPHGRAYLKTMTGAAEV